MGAVFERGHGARASGVVVSDVLNDNEWDVISEIAQAGEAALYWDIGDTKQVHLEGTCGTLSLNTDLWVYIIGINHRDVNGITFQGFKTAQNNGVSVALVDSHYDSSTRAGYKWFAMEHWGSSSNVNPTIYGGWKGCDLRYDILGSTNTAPSGYGSYPQSSRVGYNAGTTTATNPKANTLMSCLPSDLRAVMQPMTIYTDNYGYYSNTEAAVTTSIDYLPLLAEFEIFGTRTYANQYEKNKQTQYAYYSTGNNSKIKYQHLSTSTAIKWWIRSNYYNSYFRFINVSSRGGLSYSDSTDSYGLAPMFTV